MTKLLGLLAQYHKLVLPLDNLWNRILPAPTVGSLPDLGRPINPVSKACSNYFKQAFFFNMGQQLSSS